MEEDIKSKNALNAFFDLTKKTRYATQVNVLPNAIRARGGNHWAGTNGPQSQRVYIRCFSK